MVELSIKSILDAITLALRREFPDALITALDIEQDFTPPAFAVHAVSSDFDVLPSGRIRQSNLFDVIYFPQNGREECFAVSDRLCRALMLIESPAGVKLSGCDMNASYEDDLLHFFVNYNRYGRVAIQGEKMETLDVGKIEL